MKIQIQVSFDVFSVQYSSRGVMWAYPGCSNREISPLYQPILNDDSQGVAFGDPSVPQFEPTLAWLNWLMKVYEKKDEESDII